MKFKEFVNKYYIEDDDSSFYTLLKVLLFFNLIFLISSSFWFSSILSITNDLLQKQNVLNNYDMPVQYDGFFDEGPSTIDYYRDLVILVPKKMYVYFIISSLSILFWIEFSVYLVQFYFKYKRSLKSSDMN